MAFVNMKNAKGERIRIPKSAAKSYENLGFFPEDCVEEVAKEETTTDVDNVDPVVEDEQEPAEVSEPSVDEDEAFVNSIQKKPLASWNKEEVKRYAAIFDIDLTGTKSANEAKERIKAFMNNAE